MNRNRRYGRRPRSRVTLGNIGEGEVLNGAAAAASAFLNNATKGGGDLFAKTPNRAERQRTNTSHDFVAESNRPKSTRRSTSTATATPTTTTNADQKNGSRYNAGGRTPAATKNRTTGRSSDNISSPDKERTVSESTERVGRGIMTNGFEVDDDYEDEIEDLCGGKVIRWNKSNPNCLDEMTVLVIDTDAIAYESTQFVYAMTSAVPIVTRKWLKESLQEQRFKSTSHFLLKNTDIAESRVDMARLTDVFHSLSLSIKNGIEAKANGGILKGYSFFLCKDIDEDFIKRGEIRKLLTASGAQFLPARALEETEGKLDNVLIITSQVANSKQIEYTNAFTSRGGIRVPNSLILQILLLQNPAPLKRLFDNRERELEKEENNTLVLLEKKLVTVNRSLSKPNVAVEKNRGELGKNGTLQIVDIRSITYVQYVDQDGNLKFRAKAPTKSYAHRDMFGNAGKENCVVWEVTNVAALPYPINRRFFFWFYCRAELDTFLITLFGNKLNSSNQSILEEWYDEKGRFCAREETLPAHHIETDDMVDLHKRPASKPRAALMCEFGYNTLEVTQTDYLG